MAKLPVPPDDARPQAIATVIACTYNAGVGRALAFGLPTSRNFVISFNYFAADTLHTGQFRSRKAIPQGTLFPISYDPAVPHRNNKSDRSAVSTREPLLVVGMIGSVVLSLAWLALLRGCQ